MKRLLYFVLMALTFSSYGLELQCAKNMGSDMSSKLTVAVNDLMGKSFKYGNAEFDMGEVLKFSADESADRFIIETSGYQLSTNEVLAISESQRIKAVEVCIDSDDRTYLLDRSVITGFDMSQVTEFKLVGGELMLASESFFAEDDYESYPLINYQRAE